MNSYRRGLRNGVLFNAKLFIFEKVNLGPYTNYWSNLVKCFKNLYYLVRVVTHVVLVFIVSDRDPRFTTHFLKSFQRVIGTQLKKTNQNLEDMLRACVHDLKGSLEEHLPSGEFAYNNSYQASIQMTPYEALYGRPY